jgi:hypothetical protein
MAKNTPQVRHNRLFLSAHPSAPCLCDVDSPTWFAWLDSATYFRYQTAQRLSVTARYSRPMRPISVRKERRRRGFLWYANLRVHGTLYKRYVGRSSDLTVERLDEIAVLLNQLW